MDLFQLSRLTLQQFLVTWLTILLCFNHIQSYSIVDEDLICNDICLKQNYIDDFKECRIACGNAIEQLVEDGTIVPENWDEEFAPSGGVGRGIQKRQASNFVRIGRQHNGFIRIGRSVADLEHDGVVADENGIQGDKRMSSFVRIGKANPESPVDSAIDKRVSSFVRIGKSDPSKYLFKRPSSFVRIGKKSDPEEEKRYSSFVRIGKAMPENGENLFEDGLNKRVSSFVRIGKKNDEGQDSFLSQDAEPGKRVSSFVRIGRDPEELYNNEKRVSSFVRIGRGGNKRYSSFVRIGKKDQYDSNKDKRLSSFVRIGKSDPNLVYEDDSLYPEGPDMVYPDSEAQKRASSFVRIGKSYADDVPTSDKRVSSFVRIGKKWSQPDSQNKRLSSFVRIGKRSSDESNLEKVDGATSH